MEAHVFNEKLNPEDGHHLHPEQLQE